MTPRTPILAAALILCGALVAATAAEEGRNPPRVLLIGDSISGYYTPYVKGLLKGEAEVIHSGHAVDTRFGLAHIDEWLAKYTPDVVHFNWGLHDLKNGGTQVPVEEYEKNLREIVRRMKAAKARLVFATTTPVGTTRGERRDEDVVRYNAAARKVMKENNVPVNDLYALAKPLLGKIQYTDKVHFKPYAGEPEPPDEENGSKILAGAVAASVREVLKTRGSK